MESDKDSPAETTTTIEDVPIIDLDIYLSSPDQEANAEIKQICEAVSESLHKYGILIVKDPRVKQQDNSDYIDMMEEYFESRGN